MSVKLFIDFDVNGGATQGTGPTDNVWLSWAKPFGVYHNSAVVTSNPDLVSGAPGYIRFTAGRTANSSAFGLMGVPGSPLDDPAAVPSSTSGTTIGVRRSVFGLGAELFFTFDLAYPGILPATYDTPVTSDKYVCFKWGDVTLRPKSCVDAGGGNSTIVWSLRNDVTEIAMVTTTLIVAASWLYVKLHVKLDATGGLIDCQINGVAQSAVYTTQNTVAVNPIAGVGTTESADHIYFGPPILINAGTGAAGEALIDNILIDNSGWPTGRPAGQRLALGASSTNSNWSAVGTAVTTIPDALIDPTDAKAARGVGVGASTILDLAAFSTAGLLPNMIGMNLYAKRAVNRDGHSARSLQLGLSQLGVHTMGPYSAGTVLPVSGVDLPPATDFPNFTLFDGVYNAGLTTSNLVDFKARMLTVP